MGDKKLQVNGFMKNIYDYRLDNPYFMFYKCIMHFSIIVKLPTLSLTCSE